MRRLELTTNKVEGNFVESNFQNSKKKKKKTNRRGHKSTHTVEHFKFDFTLNF
jgi:hypothetical protein